MPYRFRSDITTADVAFEADGATIEELFLAAGAAMSAAMVSDPESVKGVEERQLEATAEDTELLLVRFLDEFIFFKDAEHLILRPEQVRIEKNLNGSLTVHARCRGERIDPRRHELTADVKAVTFFKFSVEQTASGWRAVVVLDV